MFHSIVFKHNEKNGGWYQENKEKRNLPDFKIEMKSVELVLGDFFITLYKYFMRYGMVI